MARLARGFLLTISVVAMSPFLRAQLVNVELLGGSLTAPVSGALSDVDLLSGGGAFDNLLGVDALGDNGLLGVSVSGQDILLLGAPSVEGPVGGALAPLVGLGDSQGTVLEFLQETASGSELNPTVLTVELPGGSDGSGSDFDISKDRDASQNNDALNGVSKNTAYQCIDNDRDSVCDQFDQCLNSPPNAMVLPSGCHLDDKAPLELRGVNFAVDTALLTASSTATLRQAARILKANPKLKIEIAGHTDDLGSNAYNQQLSERRAKAVKNYFLAEAVPASMLFTRGYGEHRPVIKIDGLAGESLVRARARNRRVELIVIKDNSQY